MGLLDSHDLDRFAFGLPVGLPDDAYAEALEVYRELRGQGYSLEVARVFSGGFLLAKVGREEWSEGGAAKLKNLCDREEFGGAEVMSGSLDHPTALQHLQSGAGLSDCEVRTFTDLEGSRGGAIFSACGTYRYLLWRYWADPRWSYGPMLGWVMLNPSTADERDLDPTLRRCSNRALAYGNPPAAGMVVANLYALRSTDPKALKVHASPTGTANGEALQVLASVASPIVCGWGVHAHPDQAGAALETMKAAGADLRCLGTTKDGHPRHPLYLPYSAGLRPLEVS